MSSPRIAAEQSVLSCFARACPAARASQAGAGQGSVSMFDDDQDSAHRTRTSDWSFSTSCAAISAGVPVQHLGVLLLFRQVDAGELDRGRRGGWRGGDGRGGLGLGLLDAHQRGVAQLVAAGLDGEQRGQRHLDVLEPAVFQFALHAQAGGRWLPPA